jgi:hypothetical protein
MNRTLAIPAVCCLLAYFILLATLHSSSAKEAASRATSIRASLAEDYATLDITARSPAAPAAAKLPLSVKGSEQMLTALANEYLRPWREFENSPTRLYSRAAPRPIPTISAEVAVSTPSSDDAVFLLVSIVVKKGRRSESIPCVVDRQSKQARLFADGQWLSQEEWLKTAPLP